MSRLLALALVAGCSSAHAADDVGIPYSCAALAAAHQIPAADHGVVAPWRALANISRTDVQWVARVQALATVPLPPLELEERVRLQHQLLQVANRLDAERRAGPAWPAWRIAQDRVLALVRAIAPDAGELASLGDGAHPRVASILGTEITERATKNCDTGRLRHVDAFGGLLAFRPLRAGETRALAAQLVAIDTDGQPHITPLVDAIELRFGKDDRASPACVVEAGDDGVLRPVAQADLPDDGMFVARRGHGVGCDKCHPGGARGRDIAASEVLEIDRARTGQVERLANALWLRLSSDPSATMQE